MYSQTCTDCALGRLHSSKAAQSRPFIHSIGRLSFGYLLCCLFFCHFLPLLRIGGCFTIPSINWMECEMSDMVHQVNGQSLSFILDNSCEVSEKLAFCGPSLQHLLQVQLVEFQKVFFGTLKCQKMVIHFLNRTKFASMFPFFF